MKRMLMAAVAALGFVGISLAQSGPIQGQVSAGCSGCSASAPQAAMAEMPQMAGMPGMMEMPGMGEMAGGGACGECERNKRFGLNPFFARLMFWKKGTQCGTCGVRGRLRGCFGNCGGANGGGMGGGFNPYPNGVPGTLVFPQNPYIRSPRDWYEK
jgi:hypothetical protein